MADVKASMGGALIFGSAQQIRPRHRIPGCPDYAFCNVSNTGSCDGTPLVIDPLHFVGGVTRIPRASFAGVANRPLGYTGAGERKRLPFGSEDAEERMAVALTHNNDRFTLAVLVMD
ncbi:MAG: hypothetical protein WDN46_04640 [Methylocella sp.]